MDILKKLYNLNKKYGVINTLLVLCIMVIFLFPLYWMFSNGLKQNQDVMAYPPSIFVFSPTFDNYKKLFTEQDFLLYLKNSSIIAMTAAIIGMTVGLPASYAIVKLRNRKMANFILLIRMIPFITFLLPWFSIFRWLGLINSLVSLIATHIVITLPMFMWIMIGFFEDIPQSLEEAAFLDGCSQIKAFFLRFFAPSEDWHYYRVYSFCHLLLE